jgi:hypothetical protein
MLTLKEIAAREDVDVNPKTVERWMKRFGIEPDQRGHGPHKYKFTTATRFVKLFNESFRARGTTPQITRAKFAGELIDTRQLTLTPILCPQKTTTRPIGRKSPCASKPPRTGGAIGVTTSTRLKRATS